ncbi:MAG: type IV pili methyl-accepting chemotaxis transducer N-terminal domain-containing protein [Thaumarchaeota archaeon]|nr:type IV pili methyl-accepting chemotaxis transducer N-terminal domain-containing protein [Nitrososphaerota archaeon]
MKITIKTYILVSIVIATAAVNLFLVYGIQQVGTAESLSIIRAGDLKASAETVAGLASSIASGNDQDRENLKNTIQSFEESLDTLKNGGTIRGQAIVTIPSGISNEYDQVASAWISYKESATTVQVTSVFDKNVIAALNYVLERNGEVIILTDAVIQEISGLDRSFNRHQELAEEMQGHAKGISRQTLLLSIGEEEGVHKILRKDRLGFEVDLRKLVGAQISSTMVEDVFHSPEELQEIPRENSNALRQLEPLWEAVQLRVKTLEENSLLSPEFQTARQDLDAKKTALTSNVDALLDSWNDELNQSQRKEQSIIQVVLGVDIAIFIVIIIVIRKSLNPLELITHGLSRVKDGVYGEKIDYTAKDEVGEIVEAFNIMSDTIRQKEEEARKIDIAKDEFLAMITHELKTPLVPIQGYSDILLSEHLGKLNPKQKERLSIIKSSSTSLLDLISDLLDAQKLELGQLRMEKSTNSIKNTIEKAVESLKPQATEKKVKIISKPPNVIILHDSERITQVLTNLIKNSLTAVKSKTGIITIKVQDLPSEIIINVKDNGTGIPTDKQKDLFKKFYQVDASLTRERGGSGLGLAICKGIVENHHGKIWLESTLNVGSTFSFSIPKTSSSTVSP